MDYGRCSMINKEALLRLKNSPTKAKQAKNFLAALLGLGKGYFKNRLKTMREKKNKLKEKIEESGYM